jgi:hypothetical protein
MNTVRCEDVRDALLAGRPPTDPELARHAEGCAHCASLLEDEAALGRSLATAGSDNPLDAALWGELERELAEEKGARAWFRSRPTGLRLALALAGVLFVTALGLRHARPDFASVSKSVLGAWLVAFIADALLAVRVALPMLEASGPRRRAALTAAFGLPLVYAFVAALSFGAPAAVATPFFTRALACFSYGTLLSTPLVGLVWLLDRGTGSRTRVLAGAATCGLAANAALLLHCPATDPAHLLAGHGAIGVALALIAWLVS